VLAVRVIFGLRSLQVLAEVALVTTGVGLTVTVIASGLLGQLPTVEVATTLYTTVPGEVELGLYSVSTISPLPPLAPVTPKVMVPTVRVKVLSVLDDNGIFSCELLHTLALAAFVTNGAGFTITVIIAGELVQFPICDTGVTKYSMLPAVILLVLTSV